MLTSRERFILLNTIPGVGSLCLRRLLDAFGESERIFTAGEQVLRQVEGVNPALAQRLWKGCRNEASLRRELALSKSAGVEIVTLEDAAYPDSLRAIPDPPLALYIRGTLEPADAVAVSLVGSRRASAYGLRCAEQLSYALALQGVTIISGLARGIDGAAHRGALQAAGRTLAVLGSGLQHLYPPEHEELAEQISQHGALISEYPMATPPLPHNFPRRNRIVSGLSLGVVVVEAAARSGALITVDCALEQGKEVFAVPGPMNALTSQGTHQLLKQGARLVTSADDIFEELRITAQPVCAASTPPPLQHTVVQTPESQQQVLACTHPDQARDIDAIAVQSGLAMADVSSILLQLELRHMIRQLPGKQFIRTG